MMRQKIKVFTNGKVILPDRIAENLDIVVDGSKIKALSETRHYSPSDFETIDLQGQYLAPGFIDLHIHGCLHHTFNEPDAEAFNVILSKTLEQGVTKLVPTLVAAPIDELERSLAFLSEWRRNQTPGKTQITGAYLESPYIAPSASGALPASAIRDFNDDSFARLINLHNAFSIFMLAPEIPGAVEAIQKLKANGIIVSLGHTAAIEEEILPAIDAGASHVTHLWSAMSMVVRRGAWRKPGLLEVALTHPELTAEIIADNRHLPPTLMKMAVQMKGDTLCAVSDALNGAGLEEGAYFYVGGNRYQVVDGVGMVEDRSVFAGSTTLLGQELPILTNVVGLSLPHAIRMISTVPARILGLSDQTGSIQTGLDADLVVLKQDLSVSEVYQLGNRVYQNK